MPIVRVLAVPAVRIVPKRLVLVRRRRLAGVVVVIQTRVIGVGGSIERGTAQGTRRCWRVGVETGVGWEPGAGQLWYRALPIATIETFYIMDDRLRLKTTRYLMFHYQQ